MSDTTDRERKAQRPVDILPAVEREHIDVMIALEHHLAMRKYSPAIINALAASYAVN
jgi:hypothetical protein